MSCRSWCLVALLAAIAVPAWAADLDPADPTVMKFIATDDDGFSTHPAEVESNHGQSVNVRCKSSQEMVLIKFDLSSLAGYTISEAELHVASASSTELFAADVSTIAVPWTEGTGSSYNPAEPGSPSWAWRSTPVNRSNPAPSDYWTVPGSDFAHATWGNAGTLSSFAHPAEGGFSKYTGTTPAGPKTFYRIKIDPDIVHAMVLDQHGLTLSDTRGYKLLNNLIYMRQQWNGAAGPWLLVRGGRTDTTPPQPMSGVSAAPGWNGEVYLSFVAPTDPQRAKAFGYDVRYSTAPINEANFYGATQAPRWRIPRPAEPGKVQQMLVTDLMPGQTYYFAMRAYDQAGNVTPIVTTSLVLPAQRPVTPLADGQFTIPSPADAVPEVPGKLRYWAVSDYTKVNPVTGNRLADGRYTSSTPMEGYKKANTVWDAANNRVTLRAARNEVVAFQLILEKLVGQLTDVQVTVSDLTGPGLIASNPNIELFRSWYVPSGGHYYPEVCIPLAPPFATTFTIPDAANNISGQKNQGVWVDIYVPKETLPGNYSGTIWVNAAQLSEPVAIGLDVAVRSWQLPDDVSFIVDLNGYHTPWSWAGSDTPQSKRSYFQLGHKHRANVNTVPHSHTLNPDRSGNVDPDRTPVLTGVGANTTIAPGGWTAFDAEWGPYLDGSIFTPAQGYVGPGMGKPVHAFYTPFFESWPLSSYFWYDWAGLGGEYWYTLWPGNDGAGSGSLIPDLFLATAPAPASAYPSSYEKAMRNVAKAFAEHAQDMGWHDVYFQFYLNNKYHWGNPARPHSQFWNLDEPSEGECMQALGYFLRIFREGVESANAPDVKWHYRIDISTRTGMSRGQLDPGNLWCCSGVNDYHDLLTQQKMRLPDQQWWYYGGGTSPTGSELNNSQRFLQVWAWGIDGALPYWNCYNTSWNSPDELAILYNGSNVPGHGYFPGALASHRLKEMRRGQQDIEYLAYLGSQVSGWDRAAVTRALQQRYADSGGDSYYGMSEVAFFQLREDVAATIPHEVPGDVDGNGFVDVADIIVVVNAWGKSEGEPGYDPRADVDGSNQVDVLDIVLVVTNFGAGL